MRRETDVAWAAGLFEGEGSVYAENQSGRRYLRFCLSSTDEDVIRRFAEIVGVGKVYGPYAGTNKVRFDWRTKNAADAHDVAALLAPWLGRRRLEQLTAAGAAVAAQRAAMSRRTFSYENARALRRADVSFREIGRLLGVSHVSVIRALKQAP
jgi:hypothetical protein